jgi:hypothetical protein
MVDGTSVAASTTPGRGGATSASRPSPQNRVRVMPLGASSTRGTKRSYRSPHGAAAARHEHDAGECAADGA